MIPLAALTGSASAAPSAPAGPATYHGTPGSAKRLTQAVKHLQPPEGHRGLPANEGPRVLAPKSHAKGTVDGQAPPTLPAAGASSDGWPERIAADL